MSLYKICVYPLWHYSNLNSRAPQIVSLQDVKIQKHCPRHVGVCWDWLAPRLRDPGLVWSAPTGQSWSPASAGGEWHTGSQQFLDRLFDCVYKMLSRNTSLVNPHPCDQQPVFTREQHTMTGHSWARLAAAPAVSTAPAGQADQMSPRPGPAAVIANINMD